MKHILQHIVKHPISDIQCVLAVAEAFIDHGFHVQGLHAYDIVRIGYLRTFFVQMVKPLVCSIPYLVSYMSEKGRVIFPPTAIPYPIMLFLF